MAMIKDKKWLMLFLIFVSFLTQAQNKKDSIVYSNFSTSLIIYNDNTFVLKRKFIDIAPLLGVGDDTLSYGKYLRYKNKALYLYTNPDIISNEINITAKVEQQSNQDSLITIIISSPFNQQRQKLGTWLQDAYFYYIDLEYADGQKITQLYSFSDTIILKNQIKKGFKKICITIYPHKEIIGLGPPWYPYLSCQYIVKNIYANYFELYIPKFTACYIYYSRYDAKEVEFIDSCNICIGKHTLMYRCDSNKRLSKKWKWLITHLKKNPYEEDAPYR